MLMTLRTMGCSVGRSASPTTERRRIDELDLEARVERVAVEVLGQVLAALRLHRFAEALERLVAGHDVDLGDLGHRWISPASSSTWASVALGWR